MTSAGRKAMVAAYKERKVVAGVYAVRCAPSGQVWVGHWVDLDTIKTRLWFTLRQGAGPQRDLIAAWRQHGEDAFSFEVLERLDEPMADYARAATLASRAAHWRETLGASKI